MSASLDSTVSTSTRVDDEEMKLVDSVKKYYGETLQSTDDLVTNACKCSDAPHPLITQALASVPHEITARFYGCGNPIPTCIEGFDVLDLGSGSGQDCYVAAKLVGPHGSVVGVDFTTPQVELARKHSATYCKDILGYDISNMSFLEGNIEDIQSSGIQNNSKDLVISNCVVNLCTDKSSVFKGVFKALRYGGEFHFSDVYSDRRLPLHIQHHHLLVGECIGGAMYTEDFKKICVQMGFSLPRLVTKKSITIQDAELVKLVGNANFFSITYRLFKIHNVNCAYVRYRGTLMGHEQCYTLDGSFTFVKDEPILVDSDTRSIISQSKLAKHFQVMSVHDEGLEEALNAAMPVYESCMVKPVEKCCENSRRSLQRNHHMMDAKQIEKDGVDNSSSMVGEKKTCC